MNIWFILVYNLVHFSPFWYVVPRKIWQPWPAQRRHERSPTAFFTRRPKVSQDQSQIFILHKHVRTPVNLGGVHSPGTDGTSSWVKNSEKNKCGGSTDFGISRLANLN
jgi:hypothetical protein